MKMEELILRCLTYVVVGRRLQSSLEAVNRGQFIATEISHRVPLHRPGFSQSETSKKCRE